MTHFKERDIRRFYDLLQHNTESGLTQLNVIEGDHLIGVGLFDNEDDFVSECERYNTLGILQAGINPRSLDLLTEYGGLKNRIRSLFIDIVNLQDIASVTGIVAPVIGQVTEAAMAYQKDVSVFGDGSVFFPLDEEIVLEEKRPRHIARKIAEWFFGESTLSKVDLTQMISVPGTEDPDGTWFHPRIWFRKYRPYYLDGISTAICGDEEE